MNRKVLIVAGAGFLGRHLFRTLQNNGAVHLTCADLSDPDIPGVEFLRMDILDPENVRSVLSREYDIVINCAGQLTNPMDTCEQINSEGIANLLLNLGQARLLHISTVGVYGTRDFADESSPLNPETSYSRAKMNAELQIIDSVDEGSYSIVRLSNLYGIGQSKGIFNYLQKSIHGDHRLHFNNDGSLVRYYIHVEDAVRIIKNMILNDRGFINGVYNLAGPDRYTVRELIGLFERMFKISFTVDYADQDPYDNVQSLSSEKLEEKLGLSYNHNVEEYIRQFESKTP